jgi:hypothetical protein
MASQLTNRNKGRVAGALTLQGSRDFLEQIEEGWVLGGTRES